MEVITSPDTYYRIVFGLVVVISLFLFLSKYLKKYPNFIPTGSGELFNVVKKQNFDSKTCFYLVDTCGKYYLFIQFDGKLDKLDVFEKKDLTDLDELNLSNLKKDS
ncbi:MAG: hypothetical protein COB02_00630 [Candidatus Cloacimonadota bacterium]|nr:MAG: hypothetical protein COB02_00630 [Candidatus Cloacimonadota bacterium]